MDCLAFILCFLLLTSYQNAVVEPLDINSIQEDIAKFNKTCYQDNCGNLCHCVSNVCHSYLDSLSSWACHCGIQCVQLGTCCIDSHYVDTLQPELKPACRSVYNGDNYFIVDECSSDKPWASLCNAEWNGEDDLQKLVPVTSLLTSMTYKNYYCLRCHETTDQFLYWKVKIEGDYKISEEDSKKLDERISLTYFQDVNTWMAIYDENIGYLSVEVSIQVPDEIEKLIHFCEPDLITDCSEKWSDKEVRSKCQSYMAIKVVERNDSLTWKYKNIHCALCNFESLIDIQCKKGGISVYSVHFPIPFSFTHLLDINRSDGELVGKIQKCSDDHIWDPYTKKCRQLTCALPGFKLQNGKCVQ